MTHAKMKRELAKIPLDKIIVPDWMPSREGFGDIVSLAKQLRSKGDVAVPIKVRKLEENSYELVWGRRRLEAAKLAGLKAISAYVERELSDEEFLLQHCLENLHRLDKDPVEEARLFTYMKSKLGRSYEQLAETLGLNPNYIYNRVELLKLPEAVIERFREIRSATKNAVGLYHLRLLLQVKDQRLQLKLLEEIGMNGLTVRQLAQRIEEVKRTGGIFRRRMRDGRDSGFHDLTYPIVVDGSGNVFPSTIEPNQEVYNWEICRKIRITHRDTHIDLPRFIEPEGKTILSYSPDKLVGRGVVIQIVKEPSEPIHPEDLESGGPAIRRGDIVVLNTGWWRYREEGRYLNYPFLTEETAEWLASRRIKMLCMDTPSPDMPLSKRKHVDSRPVHETLLKRDILIVENLYNLKVANKRLTIYVIPLYISELSEIPVKVIATPGYR